MGLLPIYPGFYRHSANLMSKVKEENENLIKLREFIASVSKKRVDQANGLILEYHRVTEKKVKDENTWILPAGEVLQEITEEKLEFELKKVDKTTGYKMDVDSSFDRLAKEMSAEEKAKKSPSS